MKRYKFNVTANSNYLHWYSLYFLWLVILTLLSIQIQMAQAFGCKMGLENCICSSIFFIPQKSIYYPDNFGNKRKEKGLTSL